MRTIERNYRKNPHTASFLQTFHTGIGSTGRNYRAEMVQAETDLRDDSKALALEAGQDDLLDLVPENVPAFTQSPAQVKFISDLVLAVNALDKTLGEQAASYTGRMDREGMWTRENTSRWIDNLKAKLAELRAVKTPAAPVAVAIPAGTYAVETDEVRCYTVDYGKEGTRWAGFLFLNRVSSDDRFPVKNPAAKAEILAAIGADVEASAILAALTLRRCRRCGKELSDTKNPYFGQGLGPKCGAAE